MSIEQYYKKQLFGSLDKNKLPGNITQYRCELVIQQYGSPHPRKQMHLAFTPNRPNLLPFRVALDSFDQPKNIIHSFHIQENQKDTALAIGEKMDYKIRTAVQLPPRPSNNIEEIQQSRSQYYPDDEVEDRFLELGDDMLNSDSDSESSSKCIEPSEAEKGNIRAEIIQFLRVGKNRFCKPKEVKYHLSRQGYKVAENRVKRMMGEVCRDADKKNGYILKDIYL